MKKSTRMLIARQTLEIIDHGTYTVHGKKIRVDGQIAVSRAGTKTLTTEDTDDLTSLITSGVVSEYETEIVVKAGFTLEAIRDEQDNGLRIAALNFASAKNPGGGFLNGASAQEESLARSSSLYDSIRDSSMYAYNRSRSTFLYSDHMIYSPEVVFWMNDEGELLEKPMTADIITAPAPNKNAMLQHDRMDEIAQIEQVFRRRISKVLALALQQHADCLILGAWGCGVFRNDSHAVARYFRETIDEQFSSRFRKIVFAVPGKDAAFEAFRQQFVSAESIR